MSNDSILIISNDNSIGEKISEKTKLLRACDKIVVASYIESISILNSTQPSLIMVYCSNADSIKIIKEIRNIKYLDKVPVILVMDTFSEEPLLFAFDNGIDDFFFLDSPDSLILIRILLSLQKSILYKQIDINENILESAEIIDKQTGIYTKEKAAVILKNFFSKSIEENLENTVFMYIKPTPLESGKRLNLPQIANIIKSTKRGNDIITYGKNNGFYIILYNASSISAKAVALRIKNSVKDLCKIYAIAAEITKSFEEMEPILCRSIKDQISIDKEFNFLHEFNVEDVTEYTEIKDKTGKHFHDFQKEFYTNFEQMVAPVFYQIQNKYETQLPDAKITTNIKETESSFIIEQNNFKSELLITYPTYMKLLIDTKHEEENKNPIVKRQSLDFEEFSAEILTKMLDELLVEFINKQNLSILYGKKQDD